VLTNREGGQVVGGVRESEAQEWMVQQAVFHDLSFKMVNPQVRHTSHSRLALRPTALLPPMACLF
jgi:hypothetical protein